jgi:spermidine synthase
MELSSSRKLTIYLLFALSGGCALVYEVLWTKYLALTFGTTMPAVSIVAATFMGGLALGSYLVGRRADEERNLLRLYAWLEVAIAGCAAASPFGVELVTVAHTAVERLLPTHPLVSHVIHLAFGAVLLIPPTVCMGGTFPLMCRFFARRKSGGQIGRLYAFNTLGAFLGTFSAGYLLIPNLGLTSTLYLAVAGNLAIAAVAWHFSRDTQLSGGHDVSAATRPLQPVRAREQWLPLLAIALIGFFSLAYEILWTRVLLLFLGNTTYAFSMILSAFLVGLAIGGAVYARMARPELDERRVLIQLTLLMALAVLVTVPFYDRLAELFLVAHRISGEAWWLLTALSFLLVFAVVGLPTILSGALLPATVALVDPGRARTGQGVGLVVLANTVGAMLGALVAGFAMVPLFGTQVSFLVLVACNLLLALLLAVRLKPAGWLRPAVSLAAATGVAGLFFLPAWDQALMNSGVYIYAPKYLQMGGLRETLARERLLAVIEGEETTVAVHESLDGSLRFFSVNGKTDGGNGADMATQLLVGHIPMLLHPRPDDVLVIGLGTGISLKGLPAHGSRRIDCVEISPEVVEAAAYFSADNGNALADPRINLLVEDGRNLLLTHPQSYDVIISEPSNPWQSGNANLFTADFYRLAARRLNPGGLFTQWIGLYDITPDNLRIAINTLLSVFPEAMAFRAGSDLILVGAKRDLHLDFRNASERLAIPAVREVLAPLGITTPGCLLARHYLSSEIALRELAGKTRLNTDNRPILEFSGHHLLGEKILGAFERENQALLTAAAERVTLPLANLGDTDREIASALHEIADAYERAGRTRAAQSIRHKTLELLRERS